MEDLLELLRETFTRHDEEYKKMNADSECPAVDYFSLPGALKVMMEEIIALRKEIDAVREELDDHTRE